MCGVPVACAIGVVFEPGLNATANFHIPLCLASCLVSHALRCIPSPWHSKCTAARAVREHLRIEERLEGKKCYRSGEMLDVQSRPSQLKNMRNGSRPYHRRLLGCLNLLSCLQSGLALSGRG